MTDNIAVLVDDRIRDLQITHLDISFNELADMYATGELIINPEYQRTFRWDIGKQSRFIETLLLEMPIPPIYVIEIDHGEYELIDGLQRISTYLSYRGILKDDKKKNAARKSRTDFDDQECGFEEDHENELSANFKLEGCDIIKELNGQAYDDLQVALQIRLKRSHVRVEVLRKSASPEIQYRMFKRLNTGQEKMEPQELRNCTIRLIDSKFLNFIKELTEDLNFKETTQIIGKTRINKLFDEDLALRFFAFKNDGSSFKHLVDDFLSEYMEKVSLDDAAKKKTFNYPQERDCFEKTFKFLRDSCGEDVFCIIASEEHNLKGFNGYIFEAVTVGIQPCLETLVADPAKYGSPFRQALQKLKVDPEFIKATVGGGKNSPGPQRTRVKKVVEMVKKLCDIKKNDSRAPRNSAISGNIKPKKRKK
ncbi:MAG: DUF262 domain-containing protein [Deltaproteobacteria bacterium]|jgi:hypothetical protein|nr:DUF262 domain-containing protein [Deltaproteobacteria bacterium]